MAKKKRREEPEVEVPDFDEVKFMRGEMRALRVTVLVVLWAIPAALVSWVLTVPPLSVSVVAFFAGIGMLFLLKWVLPILKVDISEWKRKDWMGQGSTFFFTWLAVWLLLLNPPFTDLTPPLIVGVNVGGVPVACGSRVNPDGYLPILNVSVGDNVAVTSVTWQPSGSGANLMEHPSGILWRTAGPVPRGTGITIVAKDGNGNAAVCGILVD